ncbi:50S ribosomal protein L13 [Neoehrlichia mikurensis]|uniref:Large ribosomal subunit protein uL13 n=1 Tax=Neoehrlichia mikurensis TaxID=89586 RepID=A0A9Q9C1H5_9RICK|nr:50S ribosomal protein L13 [Neoehrlichia mikurensis]QXK92393.1 50S ribosomal protein L13 [Neoehrlichia mikurensis]QXK93240.1 50S ribosomal protein L13 [Neoehrlichia mikurensis]QXK94084.1 50S ribosomal protein L13 [Neoehrlichia mikurensis]UTO55920.1 50S ribosomal protein L13 [Neoehrlichia mikurensis]UTO56838.1 50S ribosomal protein L13 [Neoehrlichia mikurensis]
MKTFSLKAKQIKKQWVVIDADGAVVGRLAAFIATVLRGKNKPEYTPHMDCGDNVIVINAEKVKFTGSKFNDKIYYRHTGYPGGIKSSTPAELYRSGRFDRVLKMAVLRMIGDGPMARCRFKNLYVYCGPTHKHYAQKPIELNFLQMNAKNKKEM